MRVSLPLSPSTRTCGDGVGSGAAGRAGGGPCSDGDERKAARESPSGIGASPRHPLARCNPQPSTAPTGRSHKLALIAKGIKAGDLCRECEGLDIWNFWGKLGNYCFALALNR
jgi:hypothetical protein